MVKSKKTIKKEFFEIRAPVTATKVYLYAGSAEELNGRIVKLDLTRSLRGKSLDMKLRVINNNGVLEAEPIEVELAGSYIRRMIRKGTDYVEDSFNADCKDIKVVVKPFMITRNKVSRAVRKSLRNEARKYIEGYIKSRTAKEIFADISTNKIQKELSLKLRKIYPLALCEIRMFKIVEAPKELLA